MAHGNPNSQVNNTGDDSDTLDALIDKEPSLASARDYGIDIWMLSANLDRPVIERIRRHQIALETFHKLKNARKIWPHDREAIIRLQAIKKIKGRI